MRKVKVSSCRCGEIVYGTMIKDSFPEHVHIHPCHGKVLSGRGWLVLGGSIVPLSKGMAYYIPPLCPHIVETDTELSYRIFSPRVEPFSWGDLLSLEYGQRFGITPIAENHEGVEGYDLCYEEMRDKMKKKGLSPSMLSHSFRGRWGISFRSWKISLRVSLVRTLLRDDAASMMDVVVDAGFYDQSQMCHQFRRYMGLSPQSYRASVRAEVTGEG